LRTRGRPPSADTSQKARRARFGVAAVLAGVVEQGDGPWLMLNQLLNQRSGTAKGSLS
jgi:hypothetical protein